MDDLMNVIKANINSFICAMKEYLRKGMEYFNKYMQGLNEGEKKLLQERSPNENKVLEETRDEKK